MRLANWLLYLVVRKPTHIGIAVTRYRNLETAKRTLASSCDSDERLSAATAIGKTNSPEAVPALGQALLADLDRFVRSACAGYLGCIKGDAAQNYLLEGKADTESYVRKSVATALFRVATPASLEEVERIRLGDDAAEVRREAERLMGRRSKLMSSRSCPFLTVNGFCDSPAATSLWDCSWEADGRGHYEECAVYCDLASEGYARR